VVLARVGKKKSRTMGPWSTNEANFFLANVKILGLKKERRGTGEANLKDEASESAEHHGVLGDLG